MSPCELLVISKFLINSLPLGLVSLLILIMQIVKKNNQAQQHNAIQAKKDICFTGYNVAGGISHTPCKQVNT